MSDLTRLTGQPVFGQPVDTAGQPTLVVSLPAGPAVLAVRPHAALEAARERLELAGLTVVVLAGGSARAIRDLVPRLQIVPPVLHDADGALRRGLGLPRFRPGAVLLDASGAVRWRAHARRPGGTLDLSTLPAGV